MKITEKDLIEIVDKAYRAGYKDGLRDGQLGVYDGIIKNLSNIRSAIYENAYGKKIDKDIFDEIDIEEGG